MVRQESFLYEKDDVIYAYGKSIPACPDCGKKMKIHGTCKRNARTAAYPDGKSMYCVYLFASSAKGRTGNYRILLCHIKDIALTICAQLQKREKTRTTAERKVKLLNCFAVLYWCCASALEIWNTVL